jgi:gliding motility-associated peptidyl-prolyl isomerase
MKKMAVILTGILMLSACKRAPQPRFPVMHTYRHDYTQSIIFNKARYAAEQKIFDSIMQADTLHRYYHTGIGMHYYYLSPRDTAGYSPREGDKVTLRYGLYYLLGDTIYTPDELGTRTYVTDKEEYFMGFRRAVKLLHKGEKAVFLVPSYAGYGLLGDGDRVPGNTPLRLYLEILDIRPDTSRSNNTQNPIP